MSARQKQDKLCEKFKDSRLETDKDNVKATNMRLQKMILTKKKSHLEEVAKNRNEPNEL